MTNHNTLATIVYEWTSFKNKQSIYRVWIQRIYHERNHNIWNSMEISLQSANIRLRDTAYVPWCWWCSKVLRLDLQPELSNIDWSLPLFWSNSPMNQLWGCFFVDCEIKPNLYPMAPLSFDAADLSSFMDMLPKVGRLSLNQLSGITTLLLRNKKLPGFKYIWPASLNLSL